MSTYDTPKQFFREPHQQSTIKSFESFSHCRTHEIQLLNRTNAFADSFAHHAMSASSSVPLTPPRSPSGPSRPQPPSTSPSRASNMGSDDSAQPPAIVPTHSVRIWFSQAVVASFVAGGVAGAVSRTVVSPLERLKILLQVQSSGHTEYKMSTPKALAKIWNEEGVKGLMAGNGTNCVRIVPYSAVQFGSYNLYRPVSELDGRAHDIYFPPHHNASLLSIPRFTNSP